MNVIEMRNIYKNYYEGQENELHILHDINMTVAEGEFVALVGESGSGKRERWIVRVQVNISSTERIFLRLMMKNSVR